MEIRVSRPSAQLSSEAELAYSPTRKLAAPIGFAPAVGMSWVATLSSELAIAEIRQCD